MATFLQKYTNFLTQKPLLGNSVTGAVSWLESR